MNNGMDIASLLLGAVAVGLSSFFVGQWVGSRGPIGRTTNRGGDVFVDDAFVQYLRRSFHREGERVIEEGGWAYFDLRNFVIAVRHRPDLDPDVYQVRSRGLEDASATARERTLKNDLAALRFLTELAAAGILRTGGRR